MRALTPRLAGALLTGCLAGVVLVGCSGAHHGGRASADSPAGLSLPPGFATPGTPTAPKASALLRAAPRAHPDIAALHRAPLPGGLAIQAAQAIVDQPVTTLIHPILVIVRQLRAGGKVIVIAADLSDGAPHDALLILQHETFRAERLIQVRFGAAAAVITLPRMMKPGAWLMGVEDVSGITTSYHNQVAGQVVLDLGIFQLPG